MRLGKCYRITLQKWVGVCVGRGVRWSEGRLQSLPVISILLTIRTPLLKMAFFFILFLMDFMHQAAR